MNDQTAIHHLKRTAIDAEKWDRCVEQAPNGWIYSLSFFLDGIGSWDALVMGDYKYIMPLPKRRKYGIPYIYVPPFTGQLGIISPDPVSSELVNDFIQAIPESFLLADLLMNELNPPAPQQNGSISRRTNYIIPLDEDYSTIYERYTEDAKKNIRRTEASGLTASQDIAMDQVVRLFVEAYGEKNKKISRDDYARFKVLAGQCIEKGYGFTMGIRDPDNDLVAAAFFGKDEKRVYYILGAPNQQGRKTNAVHSLIDEVIRKFAGTGLVFDFEGSDIPSVAQFYRKFSPMSRQYDLVQLNRLPHWLQHLRKKREDT